MIFNLLGAALVATVILIPKKDSTSESIKPVDEVYEQDRLIFEKTTPKPFGQPVHPEVKVKKIDKKRSAAKKKDKKLMEEQKKYEEEISQILNQENELLERIEEDSARNPNSITDLESQFIKIEKKYKESNLQAKITKEVTQTLLEKTKESSGILSLSPGGKVRLEIQSPEKVLLLLDGKNIWMVDYPIDDTQNKVQILKGKSNRSIKNQAFIGFLLGKDRILENFKIEEKTLEGNIAGFILKPKKKGSDVDKAKVEVNISTQEIRSISYWDKIGNETKILLRDQNFEQVFEASFFNFEVPANSQISEF